MQKVPLSVTENLQQLLITWNIDEKYEVFENPSPEYAHMRQFNYEYYINNSGIYAGEDKNARKQGL
jgi:hypothetical protein